MQSSDSKCVINCDHDCTYTKTVIWYGNITAQDFTLYSSLKKIALGFGFVRRPSTIETTHQSVASRDAQF